MPAKELFGQTLVTDGSGYRVALGKSGLDDDVNITYENLEVDWSNILNKPSTFTPSTHTHTQSDVTDFDHTHTNDEVVSTVYNQITKWDPSSETAYANVLMPRLIKHPTSGLLVEIFRLGTNHVGLQGRAYMRQSSDNGETWTSATMIYEDPDGYDVRNYGAFYTPTGRIVLIFARLSGGSTWLTSKTMYSDDNGTTWSTPVDFETPGTETNRAAQPYGNKCVIDASGNLLYPFHYGYNPLDGVRFFLAKSTDDGETWDTDYKTVLDTDDTDQYLAEPQIEDLGSGRFVIIGRAGDKNYKDDSVPFILYSSDYGENWAGSSETVSINDIIENKNNSGFLYLEGHDVSLGETGSTYNEVLPDVIKITSKGQDWLTVPYWVRRSNYDTTKLKISIVSVDDFVDEGVAVFNRNTVRTLFDGFDPSAPSGGNVNGGNGSSVQIGNDILHVTAEQYGNNTTDTNYVVQVPTEAHFFEEMVDAYIASRSLPELEYPIYGSYNTYEDVIPQSYCKEKAALIPVTSNTDPTAVTYSSGDLQIGEWYRVTGTGAEITHNGGTFAEGEQFQASVTTFSTSAGSPVIYLGTQHAEFEDCSQIYNPQIIEVDDYYYMYYAGNTQKYKTEGMVVAEDGSVNDQDDATTATGLTTKNNADYSRRDQVFLAYKRKDQGFYNGKWRKWNDGREPVLTASGEYSGENDAANAWFRSIFYDGTQYVMYYTGDAEDDGATHSPEPMWATSSDGISWTKQGTITDTNLTGHNLGVMFYANSKYYIVIQDSASGSGATAIELYSRSSLGADSWTQVSTDLISGMNRAYSVNIIGGTIYMGVRATADDTVIKLYKSTVSGLETPGNWSEVGTLYEIDGTDTFTGENINSGTPNYHCLIREDVNKWAVFYSYYKDSWARHDDVPEMAIRMFTFENTDPIPGS